MTPPHGATLGKPPFRESITSHASSHEEMSTEDLAMADPQTKILYFAKRDEWVNVEIEMETIKRSDFSMADNVSF